MTLPDISSGTLDELWEKQTRCWDMARSNYEALATVKERIVEIGNVVLRVQYNPGRIASVSSTCQTTTKRPCFLCSDNLPAEQLHIPYMDDYQILVNPFPIFRRHFTIPTIKHTPQRIYGRMKAMLELSRLCAPYTLFYNGAHCGASAPMHMHFQAGCNGFLPIEKQWQNARSISIASHGTACLHLLENMLRPVFLITATDRDDADSLFNKILCISSPTTKEEPMMNIVTRYESGKWVILIFPRKKHRPERYYATDARQRLISPGSVEMGGVIITPRPKDFEQLSSQEITEIYKEICPDSTEIDQIIARMK